MVIYMETGSTDPYYNLAFEEYVLLHHTEGDILMLWQNDNAIIIGQNQNTEAEIDADFVQAHGIRVVRRSTGGGAVYHDLGNLNYSFITDSEGSVAHAGERFAKPIVESLKGLGLDAEASGRNDILVGGQKVSGTAQRRSGGRILHHGTLLFDSDPAMIAGALKADPAKFRSKAANSVRSRIGNIRSFLQEDMTMQQFWDYLTESLSAQEYVKADLTEEEKAEVRKLRDEKYATWAWNYGQSPAFDYRHRERWPGGSLEVLLKVEKGVIRDVRFYGDFLSRTSLDDLTAALKGCPYRREATAEVLDTFDLTELFGTITKEEVLGTMFA